MNTSNTSEKLMNLEILKTDPFYYELYQKYGEQFIVDAGYFQSSATEVYTPAKLCTPIEFLNLERVNRAIRAHNYAGKVIPKFCVLVTTGSFAPIHSGHVDMMIAARRQMQKQGYTVLGGYFCPDHDAYITEKLGDKAIPIGERVRLIDKITWPKENSWLTADPWMGLYCDADVNFTVVIERLRTIINEEWATRGIEIEVIFVCGEDRVNFASTFALKGKCVVVRRSEDMTKIKQYLYDIDQRDDIPKNFLERVYFDLDNINYESSTNIRKDNVKVLEKKSLILRYDSREDKHLNTAIINLLKKYYKDIKLYDIAEQVENFKKLNVQIINLDPLMDGTINIPISRNYDNFGFKFLGFTIRPDEKSRWRSVEDHINDLSFNKEPYWLFDDDICGGATVGYIRKLLEERGVKVAGVITFLKSTGVEEVMDLRDLVVGHPQGGLVVNNRRLPYFYPWVDPYIRASILNPKEFSEEIKFINDEYYRTLTDFQKECRIRLENL